MNSCETLDREQLANHQFARLQALLGPVLASNAFYRAKFKAVGVSCPEDIPDFAAFSRLPMTTRAELSADPLYIHALIGAQIALEDGALFTQLHRRLLALDAVEAWTFLRMDATEKAYWRAQLDPYLQAASTTADLEVAPVVSQALGEIVQSRQDSLRHDEIDRLLRCWDTVSGFEIRLNRGADQFAGYALLPGELPTAFSLPTPLVAEQLKLSDTAVGR